MAVLAQKPSEDILTFSEKAYAPTSIFALMREEDSALATSVAAAKQSPRVIFGVSVSSEQCGFRVYDRVLRQWVGGVELLHHHRPAGRTAPAGSATREAGPDGNDDDNLDDSGDKGDGDGDGDGDGEDTTRRVTGVAITDDGSEAVVGLTDGTLQVWNLGETNEGTEFEAVLNMGAEPVDFVAISPDGARIAASDERVTKASHD